MDHGEKPRAIVVDDDTGIVEYLRTLLEREGVAVDTASDGEQAGAMMRRVEYDVAFVDLGLPVVSGDFILRLLKRGMLKRPRAIAVMSSATELIAAHEREEEWSDLATFLPKPFASAEVRAVLDRALGEREVPRRVLIAGAGLWADAISRVLLERRAEVLTASTASEAVEKFFRDRPAVAVLGPPLLAPELIDAAGAIRGIPGQPKPLLIAALAKAEPGLSSDLMTIGVDRVVSTARIWKLSDEVMRGANLPRRAFRRVPLRTSVLLRQRKERMLEATMFDLCEGGIGVEDAMKVPAEEVHLAFTLPGAEEDPIVASSEIAWSRGTAADGPQRLGLRFTVLAQEDRERIRDFVSMTELSVG